MNRLNFLTGLLLLLTLNTFGQTNPYSENVKQAEQYYQNKEYLKAAESYSKAFASNKNLGRIDHRYSAARCWAMANKPDSAYYNLERIAKSGYYINYYVTTQDTALKILHADKRWKKLLKLIKANKEKTAPSLNEVLTATLDTVYYRDQAYRKQIDEIAQKYGWESKEMKAHWQLITHNDSINLIKVKAILDKYGWLGKDRVGTEGNNTLFLVIQHSNQATQEKYLPMMRDAVKNGRAHASSLALLEDRVALRQGKKQIYGSQIGQNPKTRAYYVRPLEDPANVDKRRAEVNLPPLKEYVKHWGINWSIQQYLQDLAENGERSVE
ncbi:hypothetical protein FW774_14845 [Pedobacter sp. BS3]|uniref:DUF6624 domain-containing protein n=1 Tax=Pedobacter sp. BS3 TaxID=2567937 RepID=UPI0011EE71E9|nr:DUF6624 domain-containing protein [Pedobacter sp. BS3]TZF82766.1 hypothetical protein FW774_14845 [Pedobacter sp. BS3]